MRISLKNRQKIKKAAAVCLAAICAAVLSAPAGMHTVYSADESTKDSAKESELSKLKLSEDLTPDVMDSALRAGGYNGGKADYCNSGVSKKDGLFTPVISRSAAESRAAQRL